MSSYFTDTEQGRKDLQQALADHGFQPGPVDGVLGTQTARAIINARIANKLSHQDQALVDIDLQRVLGLLTIQSPAVQSAAGFIINIILNTALKGTGINMDFSKIAKAIAAAISGAGIGGGASAYTYISLPPDALAALPHWVAVGVPLVNMAIGGVVAFLIVYNAPANKPT